MAQATPFERAHSEVSAFELEDITDERLPLDPGAYTISPTIVTNERASEALIPTDLGQHSNTSSSHIVESEAKQNELEVTATLKRSAFHEWFSIILDVFLSLIPLSFLVAVLCLFLHEKPVSTYGEDIKALTLLSPTVFPIVYAAILGKLLRRIALFKAERGSTIGTLEQLIGSQSFFASIERQFGLRRINLLGLAIITAWVLSPLGGQSSLRLLSTRPFPIVIDATIQYQSVEGFGKRTLFDYDMDENLWSFYAAPFTTALQTAFKYASEPRDLFGNPRIPDINSVAWENMYSQNASDSHAVQDTSNLTYTSLFGVPVVDIPTFGNVTFTLESSYWEINCDPFTPDTSFRQSTINHSYANILQDPYGPSFLLDNHVLHQDNDTWPTGNDFVFGFRYATKTSFNRSPKNDTGVMTVNCTASFRLVESEVDCEAGDCSVQRMRRGKRDMSHIFRRMTGKGEDFESNWYWYFQCLCQVLGGATRGDKHTISSELPELWMMNPDIAPGSSRRYYNYANVSTLPPEVFSRRLQVVMNTFWDATLNSTYRTGNLTREGLGSRLMNSSAWNTTNALGSHYQGDQYICNTTFAALTIVISWLLFTATGVSVFLGIITRAPDILGYVSSLARDDPYFMRHVPSHLDGLETTRELRDVRVIIGDVRKEADIGHVAFASMETRPGRVNRTRQYN